MDADRFADPIAVEQADQIVGAGHQLAVEAHDQTVRH